MQVQLPAWLALAAPLVVAGLFFATLLLLGRIPLSYNLRNLIVRWKTTVLTALAFTIVIGLLIFMHAFATGITRLSETSGRAANVIVMSDGASDEMYSNLPVGDTSDLARFTGVEYVGDRPLCSQEVFVAINQPLDVWEGNHQKHRFMQIRGVEEPDISAMVHGLDLVQGTWFSSAGVRESKSGDSERSETGSAHSLVECIIGEGMAREFGQDRNLPTVGIGDQLHIGDRQWVVTGIVRGAESTYGSEIWAKRQKVGEIFGKENVYTSVVLRAGGPSQAKEMAERITHGYKVKVTAQTEPDYFKKMSEANKQLLGSIYFVCGIMALGGVFGVMNTMFAAIRQRTSDIGILRLIGFARWQVLASFLVEALLIAALGGGLGCLLGLLVNGMETTSVVGTSGGGIKRVSFPMIVDSTTLAAGVLFTLVMGLLGGLLPALSAMRLKPLESLR
jgi:ABC-type lipoprotein release transport system permease subunit